jgi:hypothetical protein
MTAPDDAEWEALLAAHSAARLATPVILPSDDGQGAEMLITIGDADVDL